jgi:hypothetical protein
MSSIDFVTDASYKRHIDINTASNTFNTRFTHDGKVGIGTTSPSAKLHVYGTGTVARLQSNSTYVDMLLKSSGNTGFLNLGATGMNFYVNGGSPSNLHMHISNAGNVGIGTTSPSQPLYISGAGNYDPTSSGGQTTNGILIRGGGTVGDNTYTAGIGFAHGNGTSGISGLQTDGTDQDRMGLAFFTHASGTGTAASSEAMRIEANGNVGIGTSSPSNKLEATTSASQYTGRFDYTGSSGGAYGCLKLRISANTSPSFIDFFYDGYSTTNPVGAIVTGGTNVLYQSYSDYRLKENVEDLTGALDRVNNLQPKTFNYINAPETTNEGFIAHELQEVVPQAVSGERDGTNEDGTPKYQGVDNAHIVPLLVGAIKELKAEIETLKAQINN